MRNDLKEASLHVDSLSSNEQSDQTLTHNSALGSDLPETERTAGWVASLPYTDDSVQGRVDTGVQDSLFDPRKPESKSDDLVQESENERLNSDSRLVPSNPTDCQEGVRTVDAMLNAREQPRSTSTLSSSIAPPSVPEVTQGLTWVGRLVKPVNRLIPNMTLKTTHNGIKDVTKSLLF